MAGSAIAVTCDAIVERGRRCAAQVLEVAEVNIAYADGQCRAAGTDRATGVVEPAARVRALAGQVADLPATSETAWRAQHTGRLTARWPVRPAAVRMAAPCEGAAKMSVGWVGA